MKSALRLLLLFAALLAVSLPFQLRGRHRLLAVDVKTDLIALDAGKEQYAVASGAKDGEEVPGGVDAMVTGSYLNDPPQTAKAGTFHVNPLGKDPQFVPHVPPVDAGLPLHLTESFSELPTDIGAMARAKAPSSGGDADAAPGFVEVD